MWLNISPLEKQVVSRRKDSFFEEVGNPGEEVDSCPKDQLPPANQSSKGELLGHTMGGGGYVQHAWSDRRHLGCFTHRSSSVLGSICSPFLDAVLGILAAYVVTTSGCHVVNFFHLLGGVSVSAKQLQGRGSKYRL